MTGSSCGVCGWALEGVSLGQVVWPTPREGSGGRLRGSELNGGCVHLRGWPGRCLRSGGGSQGLVGARGGCEEAGRARLSCRRAEDVFEEGTRLLANPRTSPKDIEDLDGLTLRWLRHSALTHDIEGGSSPRCCWPALVTPPSAPWCGMPVLASTRAPGASRRATRPPVTGADGLSGVQDHLMALWGHLGGTPASPGRLPSAWRGRPSGRSRPSSPSGICGDSRPTAIGHPLGDQCLSRRVGVGANVRRTCSTWVRTRDSE